MEGVLALTLKRLQGGGLGVGVITLTAHQVSPKMYLLERR